MTEADSAINSIGGRIPNVSGNDPLSSPPSNMGEMPSDRGFWKMVWKIYRSRLLNMLALYWVILIVVAAVFVPFIANSAPFTAVIDGQRVFPLFRNLTRLDLIILIVTVGSASYYWFFRRCGRMNLSIEDRSSKRFYAFLLTASVTLVCSLSVGLFKADYLDTRNYVTMRRNHQLQSAVYAPLAWGFADQEPLELDRTYEFPTKDHWLGTDGNGRDALSRLLWSFRIVLGIGLVSETIALVIGVFYGAITGYFVGNVDILGMRFVEMVEAIPTLFLLITFVALFGRNVIMLMVVIGLTSWTGIARFVRAEFLRIRQLDYVQAGKALGLPLQNILFKHMLPNGLTPVIVTFTFGVAAAVGSESILSFLGIGVEPPTPSWGSMLDEAGNPAEIFRWWLAIAPGMMIFLTVLAYNIIGEGMRDGIDPKMNKVK